MRQANSPGATSLGRATEPLGRDASTPRAAPMRNTPARPTGRTTRSAARRTRTPRSGRDVFGAVIESAEAAGPFTTLARALRVARLSDLVGDYGRVTLFAPTDRAFAKLPEGALEVLMNDEAMLSRLLAHHVARGTVLAPRAGESTLTTTLSGTELTVTEEGGAFRVNGARLVKPHIYASNGVVRAIDTVLVPR